MEKFKPMLGATAISVDDLMYPLLASHKLDGVRAIKHDGRLVSRALKPIPNRYVQQLAMLIPDGWDGELIVGAPNEKGTYNRTVSGVMSELGLPRITFYVFDRVVPGPYVERHAKLKDLGFAKVLSQVWLPDARYARGFEQAAVDDGYEGIMLRSPHAEYKFGRATLREQALVKVKRFEMDTATVIGYEELMHNANEAKTNALGRTERSSHQAGLVGRKTLGALVCLWQGKQFNIGTGFTEQERAAIWANKNLKRVRFKHLPAGAKDLPRHPVFLEILA